MKTFSMSPLPETGRDEPGALYVLKIDPNTFELKQRVKLASDTKNYKSNNYRKNRAITTDGIHLYVSGLGDFVILDSQLNELGRVELYVTDDMKKNAHDIMVKEGAAYLLDNVVRPIYTFRVDVDVPSKPRITENTSPAESTNIWTGSSLCSGRRSGFTNHPLLARRSCGGVQSKMSRESGF